MSVQFGRLFDARPQGRGRLARRFVEQGNRFRLALGVLDQFRELFVTIGALLDQAHLGRFELPGDVPRHEEFNFVHAVIIFRS